MSKRQPRSLATAGLTILFMFFASAWPQISESAPAPASSAGTLARHDTAAAQASIAPHDTIGLGENDSLPPIDSMPKLFEFVKADYPADLVKQGIEGQVSLDLVVDTAGNVDSVAVVKGFNTVLDSCAAAAARKFRFKPAIAGGKPVPVLMEYVYRFSIDEIVRKIEHYVNLKGRLVERGTRAPVRDAIIAVIYRDTMADKSLSVPFSAYLKKIGHFEGQHVENNTVVATTDSTGRFSFTSLPVGPITIKVICAGYEQLMEEEYLHSAEITEVTFHIQRFSTYGDNEVVVYGKAEEKEVAKRTLTLNEVRKVPGFAGDAVKVVQALPGVARASFISGDIVVRGASNADSRFYLDGMQIPVLFHFGGLKSTYNSDALESVDFYPGGFGTRYGDVTAGVIEIKGRKAKSDRVHATVDASFYDASFLVEGPVTKNISMLLSARRSFIGDILSWAISKTDLPVSIQPYYWDYICRTDYAASKNQNFYLTLFGSQDKFKLITQPIRGGIPSVGDGANQINQSTLFNMGIAGWNWTISPTIKNELTYSLTRGDQSASIFNFAKYSQLVWLHNLRDQASFALTPTVTLNAGLDAQVYPVDFYMAMQSAADTISRDTVKNWVFGDIGPYLNFDWKPIEQLEIIPGIRYDYFPELKYRGSVVPAYWNYSLINNRQGAPGEPSLRLTARYKIALAHIVKAAIGNYSQTPQPLGQSIMQKWGDPYLPATKATHYVGGYEWQITDLIHADVQAYYNNQWDIPRTGTFQDVSEGTIPKGYYADEKGRMYGLEVMLKHDQGKRFFGWLAYSLSRSERRDPHTGAWSLYRKDETHNLQLVGSYRLPKFWEIGGRVRFVTGDPTTPINGIGYSENNGRFFALYGAQNSARMDPFFQLDVRVEKKTAFKNWMFTWYLDIQDLSYFVYKSPEFYQYNFRYDQKTPVGSIIYPALGLTAEF
jgi:TonB family protein